ncbi:ATP-binding protein [Amycolatopsis speibonae]|uniref:ATP-binding protein n=1 Tax=Amycolatopsis speibonae TaxID=1450224 RepID=A0ABV7NRU7_9PSEU
MTALDALLSGNGPASGLDAVVISALDGAAGIGKTTLAVHWAHRVQHRFPDGTLYVNLRGYGPGEPSTPGEVLDGFLRALGTPPSRMPQGVEAQAGLYRSLLAGRRILILLDNANSADQVRPLLPATAGCMAIVTSRDSLTGLVVTESATRITLDLLSSGEARELVTGIIGPDRAAEEPAAVAELIRLCARLPLALRIAASRLTIDEHIKVADVIGELTEDGELLDALSSSGDERAAIRAVFDSSYQRLTTEQAKIFRRLGLHPGPDLSQHAAAALGGLDLKNARRLLKALAATHLIEQVAAHRYRFHDLLRAYAAEQADLHDGFETCDLALESLLDWYVRTAYACDALVFPAHTRLPLHATAPSPPPPFDDQQGAMAWLMAEGFNCLAVLRFAANSGRYPHSVSLAHNCRFLILLGNLGDWLDVGGTGLRAAQRSQDKLAETYFLVGRAEAFTMLRRWDEALAELDNALPLTRMLEDKSRLSVVFNGLGWLCSERGRYEQALDHLFEALRWVRKGERMEAVIEGNIGCAYGALRHFPQAFEHSERGLALRRQVGDHLGEVGSMNAIAQLHQGLGDHDKTIELCRAAIAQARAIRAPLSIANPLDTMAASLREMGKPVEAIACWREAMTLFDSYGNKHRADQARTQISATD